MAKAPKKAGKRTKAAPAVEIIAPDRGSLYSIAVMTKKFFPYTHLSFSDIEARSKRDVKYLAARSGGQTVGYVDYSLGSPGQPAKIWGLAVLEEWRGKGIGEALFARALNEVQRGGASKIEIITTVDNSPALRLYKKHGFDYDRPYDRQLPGKEVVVMAKTL